MATRYVHPGTGHEEEVSSATWLHALVLGVFFFMFKGIWRHVLVQVVLGVALFAAFGPPGTMFVLVMWILYAFSSKSIVENQLQRAGYRLAPSDAPVAYNPDGLTHTAKPQEAAQSRPTRTCPYCAEEILSAAIKCKHCGSVVTPAAH